MVPVPPQPNELNDNLTNILQGHENMGIITETGSGVSLLKAGDRVVMPFNVADGRCRNCEEGKTAFCTGVNPGFAGGAYGYVAMGPYEGGQAQYIRVPYADFNCLILPAGTEHEADFALLADIFPTGWHGVVLSGFLPGEVSWFWWFCNLELEKMLMMNVSQSRSLELAQLD